MLCDNDKCVAPSYQKMFSVDQNTSTSLSSSTNSTPNDDTLHVIIILVPCIVISLFISAIVASLYCYRKKVMCFSKKNHKKKMEGNKESYVLSVSKSVTNVENPQQEPQTVYENFSFEADRLNAAWDDLPESQERNSSNCSINFAENRVDDTELDFAPTFVHNEPYEEDTTTFSPMQGFVSNLLSRYDNEASARSAWSDDRDDEADDDEFKSSEEVKDQGYCVVKSNFNPNTFQYKSTPGLLGITKGERLLVLQNDLGSGWTCVRNQNTFQTGFVPSRNLNIL